MARKPVEKHRVYRLWVNEEGHDVIIRAIARMSRQTRQFESLSTVLQYFLDQKLEIDPALYEDESILHRFQGEIRVFMKIPQYVHPRFDAMRSELAQKWGQMCRTREFALLCCLSLEKNN